MHTANFPWLRRALVGAVLCVDAASALGAVYDVDTTTDSAALSACTGHANDCSLRGAIIRANRNVDWDTVNIPGGTYVLTVAGQYEDAATTGDLDITDSGGLILTRAPHDPVVIDANHIDRVFEVLAGASVDMSGLAIQGGSASFGSGIQNRGTLSLTNCTLSGNGHSASIYGGGIRNDATVTLTNTTLAGNTALFGGGISNEGILSQLTATNCTLSGNSAGDGGGISNSGGRVLLTNCTLSGNSAAVGGGLFSDVYTTLGNTLIANSVDGGNCQGPVTSLGHNLSDDSSCGLAAAGDLENVPAHLAPVLGNNGGPTQTHALCLWPGVPHSQCTGRSPALDAGDNSNCPATDQRYVDRPQDGDGALGPVCDIGAFEVPTAPCPDLSGDGKTDIVDALFISQYTVGLRPLSCWMPTAPALMTPITPTAAE